MLLLRDYSKHGLSMTTKPIKRLHFWVAIINVCVCYFQGFGREKDENHVDLGLRSIALFFKSGYF